MCALLPMIGAVLLAGCADETPTGLSLEEQEPLASVSALPSITDLKVASGNRYQVVNGGFKTGEKQYVDRGYPFAGVPAELAGATFIRTANKDQTSTGSGVFVTFSVDREAVVYVAYEQNQPLPSWLKNQFSATNLSVVHEKSGERKTFRFYQKKVSAGQVQLGTNRTNGGDADMYSVVVKPTAEPVESVSPESGLPAVSNLRVVSGNTYKVVKGGFANGALQYVDRGYPFVGVPASASGATYIRTANKDQTSSGSGPFLTFSLDREALVYVAYEQNQPLPSWLKNQFTATDLTVGHQKSGEQKTFRFYQKTFPAGEVQLGSNRTSGGDADMYTVIVAPVSGAAPAPETPAPGGSAFSSVVNGIRPRGFASTPYSLARPATGAREYFVATDGSDSNAGSSAAPFRTINKAAQVATAGDVVTIRPGNYTESVAVRNAGTADKPIVFQAAERGRVVLTGGRYHFVPAGWHSGLMNSGAVYVTLRGLVFRDYAPQNLDTKHPDRAAVGAIRGWTIEDCLFDRPGYNGVDIRGHDVTVVRSTFQYTHTNALTAWGPDGNPVQNIKVLDAVLYRNHTRSSVLHGASSEKVMKFYRTKGAVIDNVESYENNGPGWWFDTDNTDYVIRNSYFHHNVTGSGRGIFIEINTGYGLIENNVFAHNSVSGATLANSVNVTVRNNLFQGNPRSILLIAVDRGGYPLKDIRITGNQFKGWSQRSAIHPGGDRMGTPAQMNITADNNVYDPGNSPELTYWPHTGFITSIEAMRSKLGWETNGRIRAIDSPL